MEEECDRISLVFEHMFHRLPTPSDPTPGSVQQDMSQQVHRDVQCVIAGHVPRCVDAFHIEVIGLLDHAASIGSFAEDVQRQL